MIQYESGATKEWLISNGLGSYASSTIIGANTRRYHGLLVASLEPPYNRHLLLSKLEEEVFTQNGKFQLSTNKYPGVVHPRGYEYLTEFRLEPFPTFIYSLEGILLKKSIFMPYEKNAVIISYEIHTIKDAEICIRPLVNSRYFHELTTDGLKFYQKAEKNKVKLIALYPGAPLIFIGSDLMEYKTSSLPEAQRWYRNMEYDMERERGFLYRENHYCPGFFKLKIRKGNTKFNVLAAGGWNAENSFEELYNKKFEIEYEKAVERIERNKINDENLGCLAGASDSFIVSQVGGGRNIIAGYHWFSCWGRDALISLPGLCLVTGRFEDAKQILKTFAAYCKNGVIPNFISNRETNYNSIDASLWFLYAVYKYLTYTNDYEFAKEILQTLESILKYYESKCSEDGLIYSTGQQTWMDTKFTPREGKAVEVNALWYNALKIICSLSLNYEKLSEKVKENFKSFWNEDKNCLYDVIGDRKDSSVRPNQIFAVSLPFRILEEEKERKVVKKVKEELLTRYGLRSLSPKEPGYKGIYAGSPQERDAAYHNGTVWSWLIGPFVTAFLKVNKSSRERAKEFLRPVLEYAKDAGLGTIGEIFDGDAPHAPRGCISQAWSVAEVLRCYVEDVLGRRPEYEDEWKF